MNMPDHVPTTDDRYRQFKAVWTNQLSDKTVCTTRASALQLQHADLGRAQGAVGVRDPEPVLLERQRQSAPRTIRTSRRTATSRATAQPRHTDLDTLKSDFSTAALEAAHGQDRHRGEVQPRREPGAHAAQQGDQRPAGRQPLGLHELQPRGRRLPAGPLGVRGAGAQRRPALRPVHARATRSPTTTCASGKRYKQQISPRLGIAYPISDRDVLSFHYGWTYQTPARNFMFENRGIASRSASAATPTSSPRPNIAYQAGVQHLFSQRRVRPVRGVLQGHLRPDHGAAGARRVRQPGAGVRQRGLRELARLRGQPRSRASATSSRPR